MPKPTQMNDRSNTYGCNIHQVAPTPIKSKALQVNLEATDRAVVIDPRYRPLEQVVEGLPGLNQQTRALLCEMNHPFKNWDYVIRELRNYALRNFSIYFPHPKCIEVVEVIIQEWLSSLSHSSDPVVHAKALDNVLTFLERIMTEGATRLNECLPVFYDVFKQLEKLPDEQFFLLVSGYYQIARMGRIALSWENTDFDFGSFVPLYRKTLDISYQYWLGQEDPALWHPSKDRPPKGATPHEGLEYFSQQTTENGLADAVYVISHANLHWCHQQMNAMDPGASSRDQLAMLLELPDYGGIVKAYRELLFKIEQVETNKKKGLNDTLEYHLKVMHTKGLFSIHEEVLGRLNRCLSAIILTQEPQEVIDLLRRTFDVLQQSMNKFPDAALQALEGVGKEIFKSNNGDLLDLFIESAIGLKFQCPEIKGTTAEWKVEVNPTHLANVKTWLHLIEHDPKRSKKLASALIVYLKLAGLYIKDTDLFQKEISRFLNSPIAPVYNLAKQLAKLFPVYFNDINAEGELRDVSTELDELLKREDVLIHFLRKQSHVESNNLLIDFTHGILQFWRTKDKSRLASFVPPEVLEAVKTTGPLVDGVHEVINTLFRKLGLRETTEIFNLDMSRVAECLVGISGSMETDQKRILLIIRFYKLLEQKYNLIHFDIATLLREAEVKGLPTTEHLKLALQNRNTSIKMEGRCSLDPSKFDGRRNSRFAMASLHQTSRLIGEENALAMAIQGILDYLKQLKQIIFSPEQFKITEDIYRKRHIAADIPSMYGTYQERKFDALGFTFRLENLANLLFEELIGSVNLNFLTRTTFECISNCMHLLFQAMELDGIAVQPLSRCLNLLTHAIDVRRFSFTQYLDIFREFSKAEQHILKAHFTDLHKENLKKIIVALGPKKLLPKYFIGGSEDISDEIISKVSETFFRDIVATTFGFQYLDNFVNKIRHTLWRQSEELSGANLDLLLSYEPHRALSTLKAPHPATRDPIALGTKAFNLVTLGSLNMPVPDGFIITTEVFRCFKAVSAFSQADKDLNEKILSHLGQLESQTKRRFGSATNPLLLSVRSGAAISMPGMMITFLNVGLNEAIAEGLAHRTGKPWFAWDNYRRFLQSWGMSYNVDRDVFDAVMNEYKTRYGVTHKRQFTSLQMREMALAYRDTLTGAGVILKDDPHEQLFEAIRQVFLSWHSEKANTYRDIMGVSGDWGTAVIVQEMVFGNLSEKAGSGVVFTHNPHASLDKVSLWGDYTMGNQGEDVVAGLVRTHAASIEQKLAEGRDQDFTLEEAFPEVFARLKDIAKRLVYEKGWGPQEIEFTFEGETADKVFILQSRDMVVTSGKSYPVFVHSAQLKKALLAKGIGVSGGALCGKVVFTLEEISRLREAEPETPLILIRVDTVPDDIKEISAADGLLTSKGGATSHASIVAHQLQKTCVVGCPELVVHERSGFGIINGHTIRSGDLLSIDGQNGSVYKGQQETTIQPGGMPA